jgi:hypothetical protein
MLNVYNAILSFTQNVRLIILVYWGPGWPSYETGVHGENHRMEQNSGQTLLPKYPSNTTYHEPI